MKLNKETKSALSGDTLSGAVRRTCDNLRDGATKQITDYEHRFSALKNLYDELLADLIITGYNPKEAYETAKKFFGSDTVRFVGVDGTMYSRPMFDMVIFFGGAYASTGTVAFAEGSEPKVEYDAKTLRQGLGISSVVPMYVNEVPDVDQTFFSQEQPGELSLDKPLTDGDVANNTVIANSIMTFSEYFLALKLATDSAQNPRVILMDRSLGTERASLMYETRKTGVWQVKCALLGCEVDGTAVDQNDLVIGRQHVVNHELGLPPARADYLRTAIIALLEERNALTFAQIASEFGVTDEKKVQRVQHALESLRKKEILSLTEQTWSLNPKYVESWRRMRKLTLELGDKLFFIKAAGEENSGMKITKNGKEQWMTTLDISFLTLFTMQMLMEECWRRRILLIGVTKDTAARDFKRQLIPIMHNEGLMKRRVNREALQELPNTDRMILQSASIFNVDRVQPPWSLIEYDSAFRTMLPDSENRKGYVSGAIRNKISLERAFLKTYVQLSVAKSDPLLRSNVLLVDRLAHPEYDCKPESSVRFWNSLSDGTREPVDVLLFKDRTVPNRLQNLAMAVLVAMAPSNIPEAFGHNKALFIADKVAKWNYGQFKRIVDTTALWILNNHKLRRFIFYMSTFRERRAAFEQARRDNI